MSKIKRQLEKSFNKFRAVVEHVQPRCRHFKECGGCKSQDVFYENQLRFKEQFLNSLFKQFKDQFKSKDRDEQHITIIPSDNQFFYRNRMDYACSFGKIGFRKQRKFDELVDIHECFLMDEKVNNIINFCREKIKLLDIKDYDLTEKKGFLRYIVVRMGKFTNEFMQQMIQLQTIRLEITINILVKNVFLKSSRIIDSN